MDTVAEIFAEIFFDIFGELFLETSGGLVESRYVPKWLRALVVTFFGALLAFIAAVIFAGNKTALAVFETIIAAGWLILLIKALRIETRKYEYVKIDENRTYKGKRNMFGMVCGELDLSNLGYWTEGDKSGIVAVNFEKDDSLPKKQQIVVMGEAEEAFLKDICSKTELDLAYIGNRAKDKLAKKLKNSVLANNGRRLRLERVVFVEKETEAELNYTFYDTVSKKKVIVTENKELSIYKNDKKSQ